MRLEQACQGLSRRVRLAIHLKALTKAEGTARPRGRPHLISVYGADRPGIVYRVSELLAGLRVNITDVSTRRTSRRTGTRTRSLYLMLLEVELPPRLNARDLERRLRSLARRLGVSVSLRSAEAHVL